MKNFILMVQREGRPGSAGSRRCVGIYGGRGLERRSFFAGCRGVAGPITVKGLDGWSTQADKAILQALCDCGASVETGEEEIRIGPGTVRAFRFDATDCPDLFPPLVALAAYCEGTTVISGVSRLAHKESNRGLTLQEEFGKMGIAIDLVGDTMLVRGGAVKGARVHSRHDHRIAMACAVAALGADGEVTIEEAQAIDKSYPDFYQRPATIRWRTKIIWRMNSFGRLFRVTIFGESHGESVGINIDGCPAGLPLALEDFLPDLERRKGGFRRGRRRGRKMICRSSRAGFSTGVSTGAPITILFENNNTRSGDYEKQRAVPRPGHADFVAHKKFGGFEDYRGGGAFSARLTVGLVAAAVIAKKLMGKTIQVKADILEIGGEADLEKGLQKAIDAKDSIGGIVECRVSGLPVGLGEPFFDSVESLLAHAALAIPAVRGVEFGTGFARPRDVWQPAQRCHRGYGGAYTDQSCGWGRRRADERK